MEMEQGKMSEVTKAQPDKRSQFDELGASGLLRTGTRGLVIEEFLPALSGTRANKVYREMRDNDPVVGAMLFAIEMLIRNVDWRVEGDEEPLVEFVESCMVDMSHTWADFVAEALSMLTYGWSWHEVVYKRRMGPSDDPTKNSRFDDGKIGWRKLPIRSQDSLNEWEFDDDGSVKTMVQVPPPFYNRIEIPINRSLLFRTGLHKNNPEGRSILRTAYRPWFFKKRIEEIEGIGVERDLAGLPIIYRTSEVAAKYDPELIKILRNVKRDEQEGLLLPLAYDDNNNQLLKFELLSAAGQRQLDTNGIIDRYNRSIAMTCLADFILLGQQSVGSFALASSKTELFANAIGAVLQSIADVMNRYAIPRLLAINGMTAKKDPPKLVPGDIETPDLGAIGSYISALANAGAPLFPDDNLEDHLRKLASLPPIPNDRPKPLPPQPPPIPGVPPVPGALPQKPKPEQPQPKPAPTKGGKPTDLGEAPSATQQTPEAKSKTK